MITLNPFTFFNLHIDKKVNTALYDYKIQEKKKAIEDKHTIYRSSFPKGKLFISISNEWVPLLLVEIIDYHIKGSSILPIIKDIRTQEVFLGFSKLIPYSEAMLSILLKLDPFQRYSVTTGIDITNKSLILEKKAVNNEPTKDVLLQSANDWLKDKL
jgi:hypothetical protein